MKPNSTNPSPTSKENMSPDDHPLYREMTEGLKKVVENNTQLMSNFEKFIQNSSKIIGTNEKLAATIDILTATNKALVASKEHIFGHSDLEKNEDSEAPLSTSGIAPLQDWENHYSVLKEDQRKDPVKILSGFVHIDTLFEQRENLLLLFWAALQSQMFEDDDAEVKSDRFFFYNTLVQLVEGVYRVVELIEKGQLTFSYASKPSSGI